MSDLNGRAGAENFRFNPLKLITKKTASVFTNGFKN
jgi:hypothetical protein